MKKKTGHEERDHHRAGSLIEDEVWCEHLEAELEKNLEEDLKVLLGNSKADSANLAALKRTREMLKSSDDVAMPESGAYHRNLHDKIMAAVEFEAGDLESERQARATAKEQVRSIHESQPIHATYVSRTRRIAWPSMFGAVGLTMMLALISWVNLRNSVDSKDPASVASVQSDMSGTTGPDETLNRSVAQVARSYSNEVNGFEPEEDIVAETAIARIRNLSPQQVEDLYRSLRE